jgi:FMN-dependent NADH-azoreductase
MVNVHEAIVNINVDTEIVSHDIVLYMPMYMVNVPHDMLKAYMDIVNVPQGMVKVSMDILQVS